MNCERCGIEIDEIIIYKRQLRGDENKNCLDCRMKPKKEIKYNKERCTPWQGEVDDDFNPIDKKGKLYLPGIRTCGHKDCVKQSHIINDLEVERWSISYRTGKKPDFKEIMKELH